MEMPARARLWQTARNRRELLVERWYSTLLQTASNPPDSNTLRHRLRQIADQAITLLFTDTFMLAEARSIGVELVRLGYTQPDALEGSLMVLEQHLRSDLPTDAPDDLIRRLGMLIACIAAGFTAQVRAGLLTGQAAPDSTSPALPQSTDESPGVDEAHLQTLFAHAPISLIIVDNQGGITAAAGKNLERAGISAEALVGRSVFDQDTLLPFDPTVCHRALAGEEIVWNATFATQTHEVHFLPVRDTHEAVTGVIILSFDVTKQEQTRAALEAEREQLTQRMAERTVELSQVNAELLRANRLRDNFLASLSHELRTPLNAILGLSDALREETYGPIMEKQDAIIQQIEASGQRLFTLISDMLDLARINAGKVKLERYPTDVVDVCQTCLRRISRTTQEKNLSVLSSFDPRERMILADPQRLSQMVMHLLDNAVKFTPEGGAIGIEVSSDEEHQVVCITVWDNGIGISDEDLPQLFQPFSQIDGSLTRIYGGTGLGLILVYYLTELHGGSVSVTSKPGQGSRFTICLPWNMESLEPALPDSTAASVSGQPVVLVAEDDLAVSDLLAKFLQRQGYQVTVAYNGAEAIQRAHEVKPSVITMDIQMPVLNGLDAIRRVRADADLAHIPIIAVTALAMPGDRERCLAAGANAYLSKPVSLRRLSEAIEQLRHKAAE